MYTHVVRSDCVFVIVQCTGVKWPLGISAYMYIALHGYLLINQSWGAIWRILQLSKVFQLNIVKN